MATLLFSLLLAASAASAQSECVTSPTIPEPRLGLAISFETDKGLEMRQVLGRTISGATEYKKLVKAGPGGAYAGEEALYSGVRGVIPVANVAESGVSGRRKVYDQDPLLALSGRAVGETITIAATENSTFDGRTKEMDAPLTLIFLGCFTEDIAGTPERLLKYKVVSTGRRPEKGGKEGVYRTTRTVAVSARLGWWVYAETDAGRIAAKAIGFE